MEGCVNHNHLQAQRGSYILCPWGEAPRGADLQAGSCLSAQQGRAQARHSTVQICRQELFVGALRSDQHSIVQGAHLHAGTQYEISHQGEGNMQMLPVSSEAF